MITGPFPSELEQLVSAEIQAGTYPSANEVLLAGVRMLREKREEFERVKAMVQHGIDQHERGEYHEYTREELREFFERLKQRARLAGQASQQTST